VRIEDLGDVLGTHFLLNRPIIIALVVGGKVEGLDCLSLPQPKQIRGPDPITKDRGVVRFSFDNVVWHPSHPVMALIVRPLLGVSAKFHLVVDFWANNFPRIAVSQPFVSPFNLPTVPDRLLKDPKFVPNAVTDRRDLQ